MFTDCEWTLCLQICRFLGSVKTERSSSQTSSQCLITVTPASWTFPQFSLGTKENTHVLSQIRQEWSHVLQLWISKVSFSDVHMPLLTDKTISEANTKLHCSTWRNVSGWFVRCDHRWKHLWNPLVLSPVFPRVRWENTAGITVGNTAGISPFCASSGGRALTELSTETGSC